jgi:uncharacterized protein (TIGR02466 family)|tara:strand:- start:138 stop:746 length:609 start_codon:yes stop_codon:yes gene_type:complete
MKWRIQSLFSTALYVDKLDFKFNKKQFKYIKTCERKENTHNVSSLNSYVLNLDTFKNLKKKIEEKVAHYLLKIDFAPLDTEFFITQSWFNYTKEKQAHHEHEHPNSYLSGVYYIDANKKLDSIMFSNKRYTGQISLPATQYNDYNSKSYKLSVSTDDIILFPSSTTHRVDTKKGKNERLSLAFNVFIKGNLGDEYELWKLKI